MVVPWQVLYQSCQDGTTIGKEVNRRLVSCHMFFTCFRGPVQKQELLMTDRFPRLACKMYAACWLEANVANCRKLWLERIVYREQDSSTHTMAPMQTRTLFRHAIWLLNLLILLTFVVVIVVADERVLNVLLLRAPPRRQLFGAISFWVHWRLSLCQHIITIHTCAYICFLFPLEPSSHGWKCTCSSLW